MKSSWAVAFVGVVVACSSGEDKQPPQATEDIQAVERFLYQYYSDMTARDWDRYRSNFWPNATITTVWQPPSDSVPRVDVTTIDDFIREAPSGPGSQPVFEESMLRSEISIRGNLAEAWVDYRARFGTKDSLLEWNGKDLFTLLRHDGEWKIVSIAFESDFNDK